MDIIKFKTKFVEEDFVESEANILNHITIFLEFGARIRRRSRRVSDRSTSRGLGGGDVSFLFKTFLLFIGRVITGDNNLAFVLVTIVLEESLDKLATF